MDNYFKGGSGALFGEGVFLTTLYVSGPVTGFSASGITGGLAAIGGSMLGGITIGTLFPIVGAVTVLSLFRRN
jgi:hypothetical protein